MGQGGVKVALEGGGLGQGAIHTLLILIGEGPAGWVQLIFRHLGADIVKTQS